MIADMPPAIAAGQPSGARCARRDVDGILLLDKPAGLTSNQALQAVKRLFRARKAGHTGSLDPLASGMLPICLGQATKVSAYLLESDKSYRVRAAFGVQTATGDAEGPVTQEGPTAVTEAELLRVLQSFRGQTDQTPPMYSALKHQGQRLYHLARAGKEVPRSPRTVLIHDLVIEAYDPRFPVLRVRCSKGTYIRTLVEDIARAAGTVGHVADLRRLSVGPTFPEGSMVTMAALEVAADRGCDALDRYLQPADRALWHWPELQLTVAQVDQVRCGQAVSVDPAAICGRVRLYDADGRFVGLGEQLPGGQLAPRRLMAMPEASRERESGL